MTVDIGDPIVVGTLETGCGRVVDDIIVTGDAKVFKESESGDGVLIPDDYIEPGHPVEAVPSVILGKPIRFSKSIFGRASLWTGDGPPGTIIGASVGDEYLDIITGDLYRLDPGA